MPSLTEITGYADSHRLFSKSALWSLFDGDRETLNIGHECVDRHPREKIAIHIISAAETQGITYGELADWSNRFANFLTSKGYPKGARIGLMLEPSLLFYASLLGAMKAGYVAVPLFTLFGPDGLRLRIADCEPVLLLAEEALVELAGDAVTTLAASAATMAEIEQHSPEFSPRTAADDMAMYQYTSGTTRELPEAVKHRHRAVVTVIIAALYGTGVRPGDRFCCPSSPAWGHGLWHGTLAPLALGATIASYRGKFAAPKPRSRYR
ncbi:MAG: AMP-binding protein [Pseudomonadota bacterium]